MKNFKDTLSSQQSALGNDHVDVALTLQTMGDVYQKIGKDEKARSYFYKSLRIRRKVLGEDHVLVALTLDRLGQLH